MTVLSEIDPVHGEAVSLRIADNSPECELGLGRMYARSSARFSALHTFQAFGNSEKPSRNNGLRSALAVE